MFVPDSEDTVQFMRSHIHQHVRSVCGSSQECVGIELAGLIRMVSNLYEAIGIQRVGASELSGARWQLLFRLLAEERRGHNEGLTPSYLSRCQSVSKNTTSALLRGLEEQGLIVRARDPLDLRVFRIQLSDAGRELVESTFPRLLAQLNSLISDLTPAEQTQLADLLEKLCRSLLAHARATEPTSEQG